MVLEAANVKIEVDVKAAEILRHATDVAHARGETLGVYLSKSLPHLENTSKESRLAAWTQFVEGMSDWSRKHLPPGYVADDSRDPIYNDNN
jgi:hypothetical protein